MVRFLSFQNQWPCKWCISWKNCKNMHFIFHRNICGCQLKLFLDASEALPANGRPFKHPIGYICDVSQQKAPYVGQAY